MDPVSGEWGGGRGVEVSKSLSQEFKTESPNSHLSQPSLKMWIQKLLVVTSQHKNWKTEKESAAKEKKNRRKKGQEADGIEDALDFLSSLPLLLGIHAAFLQESSSKMVIGQLKVVYITCKARIPN